MNIRAIVVPNLNWRGEDNVRQRHPHIRVAQIRTALNLVTVASGSLNSDPGKQAKRNIGRVHHDLFRSVGDAAIGAAHHHRI